jgi:lipid A 3-O-deacylase
MLLFNAVREVDKLLFRMIPALLILLLMAEGHEVFASDDDSSLATPSGVEAPGNGHSSVFSDVAGFFRRLGTPERAAGALSLSSSYDPNFNLSNVLASASVWYDHGILWDQVRSGSKAFKLEAVAGSMVRPNIRGVASLNMMSIYYPAIVESGRFRPYMEAGIGAIYTDYRVDHQAYRFNFNPQLGIGTEVKQESGSTLFVAMRLHHISNGSINHNNQGVNSLLFQIGRFF